jgi:hypothetical protein
MKKPLIICVLIALSWQACKNKNEDGDPVEAINAGLSLPAGSFSVDPDTMETDYTVTIDPGIGGTMPLSTGTNLTGQITFSAPSGNVVAGGMRFGTSGPVNMVPVAGAIGQTSGTLTLPFALSASTCQDLASICHNIKCYEYAMTADGKITQANIRDVALMCGGCGEPSCVPLISPPCPPAPCSGSYSFPFSTGSGTCSCSGSTVSIINSNGWAVVASNVPSGSTSFTPGYYDGSCTSCPALQITAPGGDSYIAISGSGSWSGTVYSFSCTMKSIPDFVSGTGSSYTLTGTVNCGN